MKCDVKIVFSILSGLPRRTQTRARFTSAAGDSRDNGQSRSHTRGAGESIQEDGLGRVTEVGPR